MSTRFYIVKWIGATLISGVVLALLGSWMLVFEGSSVTGTRFGTMTTIVAMAAGWMISFAAGYSLLATLLPED